MPLPLAAALVIVVWYEPEAASPPNVITWVTIFEFCRSASVYDAMSELPVVGSPSVNRMIVRSAVVRARGPVSSVTAWASPNSMFVLPIKGCCPQAFMLVGMSEKVDVKGTSSEASVEL